MSSGLRSAHTAEQGSAQVVEALARQLEGSAPKAIVFFASHRHDGAAISGGLRQRFAGCEVVGCTTAGEFTQAGTGLGGVTALPDGGLKFYCKIQEGMDLHLMAATDLIGETRAALARSKSELGGKLSGGLAFNCILRRLDLDAQSLHAPFVDSFQGTQLAGFHTYGESYLGHINQTLTALMFA